MIRPRGGDFVYSSTEFVVMQRDIELAKAAGADGVVLGLLLPEGVIDAKRTAALVQLARPLTVTFHRAFDMVADLPHALEVLIDLGIERVLTSGGEASALEGAETLAALVGQAADRIVVMPGGGINERNIARIAAQTGAHELHLSGRRAADSAMRYRNQRVPLGGALYPTEYNRLVTAAEKIRAGHRALMDIRTDSSTGSPLP
jgi:copper homeostasis protein